MSYPPAGLNLTSRTLPSRFPRALAARHGRFERIGKLGQMGDVVRVKVLEVDRQGRVRLSMRNVFGRPVLDIGTRTRVAWSPGALVVFR